MTKSGRSPILASLVLVAAVGGCQGTPVASYASGPGAAAVTLRSAAHAGCRRVPLAIEGLDPRPKASQHLDSTRFPLSVHWDAPTSEARGRRFLALAELAWQREVVERGWPRPLPDGGRGGSDNLDLYLEPLGKGEAYVAEETRPAGPFAVATCYIGFDRALPDDGTLESYVMHEFNHACQYALDANEGNAFYEHTAAFMDRLLVPAGPGSKTGIADFQAAPQRALDSISPDGADDEYEYGAALFLQYLSQQYANGSDKPALRLWQGGRQPDSHATDRNEPDWVDVLPGVLSELGAPGLDDVLTGFQAWRLESSLQAGATLPKPKLVHRGRMPASFSPKTTDRPSPWGVNYLQLDPGQGTRLQLQLQAGGGNQWRLWAGVRAADGHWLRQLRSPVGTTPALAIDTTGADQVYVAVLNFGHGEHDPDRKDWRPATYRLDVQP